MGSTSSDASAIFDPVPARLTNRAFVDEVPRLLKERGWSIRELARRAQVTDAHLSRVLRKANYKTPSGDLARKVAIAFELPEDYFAEFRESFVVEQVRRDARLRDRFYAQLRGHRRAGRR